LHDRFLLGLRELHALLQAANLLLAH
jgi:hypothetical protein